MEKELYDPEAAARVLARCTRRATGCLESNNPRRDGYAYISYKGNRYRLHRLAYRAYHGPIPEGLYVCHRCDNPKCAEVTHLFLGTPEANAQDCCAKGRNHKNFGIAKITPDTAAEIKRRLGLREIPSAIARSMASKGVTETIVSNIRRGRTWKNVRPAEEQT